MEMNGNKDSKMNHTRQISGDEQILSEREVYEHADKGGHRLTAGEWTYLTEIYCNMGRILCRFYWEWGHERNKCHGRFEKNEIKTRIIIHVVSIEIHKNKHYDMFVFAF